MISSAEVAIVGAGAIGCAAAYFLSKEGVSVVIVEKDAIASHASGHATGSIAAVVPGVTGSSPLLPLAKESIEMHKLLYQELQAETGIDYHLRNVPDMRLAFTEAEADQLKSEMNRRQKEGFQVRWLEREDTRAIESRVSPKVIGAAYYEERCQLNSYRYVLALIQGAEKCGAVIRNREVVGLKRKGAQVKGLLLSSGEIACERVVLAQGPWTGLASSWLAFSVPVRPLKGQILRLQAPGPPLKCQLSWKSFSVRTKDDGLIWAGGTKEDVGFDEQPTREIRNHIEKGIVNIAPSLEEAELVLQTACLRPFSADDLPIIGEVPDWRGVYLATGVGRMGMTLSAVIGRLICDLIVKGHTSLPMDSFAPIRFAKLDS